MSSSKRSHTENPLTLKEYDNTDLHISQHVHSLHIKTNINKVDDYDDEEEETPNINLTSKQDLLKNTSVAAEDHVKEEQEVKKEEVQRDLSEMEIAATKIQSAYRDLQTRKNVRELVTEQNWRQLIDFSRKEYIHKMDAENGVDGHVTINNANEISTSTTDEDDFVANKAKYAWRRAEFLGSQLGKGSHNVKSEEALVLCYHTYWLDQDTSQNFFYWLDKGDGKDIDLEERPRARLNKEKVQYLQEHERQQHIVTVKDGLLYYAMSGEPVHTLPENIKDGDSIDITQISPDKDHNDDEATRLAKKAIRSKFKFIYVSDPNGALYVAQKIKGKFHHSSFLGGGTVCAAGAIVVNRGKIIKINPKSGHYRPEQRHFEKLLKGLEELGVSFSDVKVSSGILAGSSAVPGGQGEHKPFDQDVQNPSTEPTEQQEAVESEKKKP
ncbi:hypothetical protein BGZ76_007818 [Entomortierella beljakovae]|nr:hypothetical protein BGZ76_007818 [Entomortierella beljakovae]